jgi:Polyketide cyclase / dehydrase and lipid transport
MNWTERRKRRARRRLVIRLAIATAALIAATSGIGFLFPVRHEAAGRILLEPPPETVWRLLTDLDGMPLWRSDVTALERLPDLGGRPAWREIGPGGPRTMEQAEADPPHRLVLKRTRNGRPVLPIRTFELVGTPEGTLVTLTEDGEVRNPLGRILVRLRTPPGGILRFLRDLDQRLNGARRQVATTRPE